MEDILLILVGFLILSASSMCAGSSHVISTYKVRYWKVNIWEVDPDNKMRQICSDCDFKFKHVTGEVLSLREQKKKKDKDSTSIASISLFLIST
jgi:hypothetical protein